MEVYDNLLKKSNSVIFDKKFENGVECNYELAILEKSSGSMIPIFIKDEFGRQSKVNLEDDKYIISKINNYKILVFFYKYNRFIRRYNRQYL